MKHDSQATYDLLHQISHHLSSRDDLRKVEYTVSITDSTDILLDPDVLVFPDIHRRKSSDKISVVRHILNTHIDTDTFVDGVYKFQLSYNQKRRRWTKISN